ncbi:4-carboxymuconolactone decarboxylase [Verticiella sediminum]|uniref:4-carboxymuconolactone decarboxylase n=1 Tax=Verticiella sediminum TaxID=1247510 RepID=A0A556AIE1_9BURK|nr:carboxymuconolactone decarboxylase family protein [Verticiella sediminum]TSH92663.1 4-carboxymuconolactone decarboxylase [Verticiella sediminum]
MTEAVQPPQAITPDALALGERHRRQTMGDAFVDSALAAAREDEFMKPLQEAVTGLAWGAVWGRPGLSLKHRSLVTVSVLVATGRRQELKGHIRGLLNNGWTVAELQEILLHCACYCGMPAAVDGFRVAQEVLAERAAAPAPAAS